MLWTAVDEINSGMEVYGPVDDKIKSKYTRKQTIQFPLQRKRCHWSDYFAQILMKLEPQTKMIKSLRYHCWTQMANHFVGKKVYKLNEVNFIIWINKQLKINKRSVGRKCFCLNITDVFSNRQQFVYFACGWIPSFISSVAENCFPLLFSQLFSMILLAHTLLSQQCWQSFKTVLRNQLAAHAIRRWIILTSMEIYWNFRSNFPHVTNYSDKTETIRNEKPSNHTSGTRKCDSTTFKMQIAVLCAYRSTFTH